MPNYQKIQLIAYGVVTSEPTQVLDDKQVNDYQADAKLRAQRLCQVADYVATSYAGSLADPDTLKVLVAPEFYFRYGGLSDPTDALRDSYPNGELLLPTINEEILRPHFVQDTFADWLIVAGSMFWHKSAADSKATHPTYLNTVLVLRGGRDTELTAGERDANGESMTVPTMGASSTNQKRFMSTIDYGPVDRSHWDAAINRMFQPYLEDPEWLLGHMFKVHGVNGPEGRPLVFGLEVCLEHIYAGNRGNPNTGILRDLRTRYPDLPEIDVQVVTSCGMTLNAALGVEARIAGHVLQCDGAQPRATNPFWPTAAHNLVTDIGLRGSHDFAPAAMVNDVQILPDNLQLGLPNNPHNPRDAVSVWSTAKLNF